MFIYILQVLQVAQFTIVIRGFLIHQLKSFNNPLHKIQQARSALHFYSNMKLSLLGMPRAKGFDPRKAVLKRCWLSCKSYPQPILQPNGKSCKRYTISLISHSANHLHLCLNIIHHTHHKQICQ